MALWDPCEMTVLAPHFHRTVKVWANKSRRVRNAIDWHKYTPDEGHALIQRCNRLDRCVRIFLLSVPRVRNGGFTASFRTVSAL
jgi:hypothetical protein